VGHRPVAIVGPVMRRTALAIVLAATAAVSVATVVIATVVALVTIDRLSMDLVVITVAVLAMATVGSVLALRVPANAVGLLLVVSALTLGVQNLGAAYAMGSLALADGSWPSTALAAWLDNVLLPVPVLIMTVVVPLIFPDGHLLSGRWRWAVAAILLSAGGAILASGFAPRVFSYTNLENPFYVEGLEPLLSAIAVPGILGVVVFPLAIASVAIRYRRGNVVERQQLKWLIAATAFAAIAWIVAIFGTTIGSAVGWSSGLLAFVGFPVAIGIAVLRYRLYEIDRIIKRTIAWAVVTGLVVTVFVVAVIALQAVLTDFTQGETVAVAASTLVAAALFQPLRRRVQRIVDRRFDRAAYDTRQTVEAFAERLRDEVALDAVVADLHEMVATSIKPTSLALWLRPTPPRSPSPP
jgi:hypothetical protein